MPLMPADVEAKLVVERRRKQDGSSAAVTVWLPTKELEAWGHDVAFRRLGALAVLPLYSATLFGVGEDFSRSGRPPIRTRFLHDKDLIRGASPGCQQPLLAVICVIALLLVSHVHNNYLLWWIPFFCILRSSPLRRILSLPASMGHVAGAAQDPIV
jgi:hypothetical protein